MPKEFKPEEETAPKVASKSENWWQTLPGMLTAIAGIITAVSGLLLAIHQTGLLESKQKPTPQLSPTAPALNDSNQSAALDTTTDAAPPTSSGDSAASTSSKGQNYSAVLPAVDEVTFRNNRGEGTIKIVAVQVERRSVDNLALKFTILLTNNGPSDVGFGTDMFRLLIDGVPRAPVNWLNDSVEARSAKEGDIEFEASNEAESFVLQVLVGDNDEFSEIPITLKK